MRRPFPFHPARRRAWCATRLVQHAAVLVLLGATAPALGAQQGAVVVGTTASPFEREVDRLVQELLQKRRLTMGLVANLRDLQGALRGSALSDAQRVQVEGSLRQLRNRLAELESEGTTIQRRLGEICDADRQPAGWVGIAYTVSASATRQDDGRVVMRFVNYPSIESVEPGSPADKAGIRSGDRLLAMAGQDLQDAEIDLTPLLKPGTRIPIKVRRGAETRVLTVTVAPRPNDFSTPCPWVDERIAAAFAPGAMTLTVTTDEDETSGPQVVIQRRSAPTVVAAPTPPVPPLPPVGGRGASSVVFGGAQFIPVSPELAEALGVERGLLVVAAGRGSPAEQSGLRTGDVLVSVDGRALSSPLIFLQAVEQSTRRELRLQVMRRQKPQVVTLRW